MTNFPALLNVLIGHSSGAEGGASSSARLRRLRARVRLPVSVRLGGPLIDRCYPSVKLYVSDQYVVAACHVQYFAFPITIQLHVGVALHHRGDRVQGAHLCHGAHHDLRPPLHGGDHRVRGEEFEGAEGEQMEGRLQGPPLAPLRRGKPTGCWRPTYREYEISDIID